MPFSKFLGGRILKTGIAVFITAFICLALEWPAIFAVITAIVTIEPTASDSIKKGIIRLPASVIGAAYSMLITAWFGNTALTYSLSAMLTIITCHKLKLDAGILVATLTAVNMIPFTHDHFFDSFLVRLGTTTIGLAVSTLINLIILPPHYSKMIVHSTSDLLKNTGELLEQVFVEVPKVKKKRDTLNLFQRILKDLDKAEQLCQFQRQEWKYHKHTEDDMRKVHYEHKKLLVLRQILFHIGNIIHAPIDNSSHKINENKDINDAVVSISLMLIKRENEKTQEHEALMNKLLSYFWELKCEPTDKPSKVSHFTAETMILFEIVAINDLTEELRHIEQNERKKHVSTLGLKALDE